MKQVEDIFGARDLDILINNAGINQKFFGPIAKTYGSSDFIMLMVSPVEDFKHTFDVNFIGVQNVTSAFLPVLRRGTKKIIVDVSTFPAGLQLNDGRWKMYAIHAYNVSISGSQFSCEDICGGTGRRRFHSYCDQSWGMHPNIPVPCSWLTLGSM